MGKIRKIILNFIRKRPILLILSHLFKLRIGTIKNLESIHNQYKIKSNKNTSLLDLGCGQTPQNRFNANQITGIDLVENSENNVLRCNLGFEALPFDDNSFDYLTAYDFIEHIPRFSEVSKNGPPFIFFMNECYRVLKKEGIFLSMTPIYPFLGAFQDPTHNNIITVETFKLYFSDQKFSIAHQYGIKANFKILNQKMFGEHLIAVMTKN